MLLLNSVKIMGFQLKKRDLADKQWLARLQINAYAQT
jgi:hypothetical protein